MGKRKKGRTDGMVYTTGPTPLDWSDKAEEEAASGPSEAVLRLEKKGRGGKSVTVVELRNVTEARAKEVGKLLKQKCGVGGTTKGTVVEIQGDQREDIRALLREEEFRVKG
jgi:translation initiation factor 1